MSLTPSSKLIFGSQFNSFLILLIFAQVQSGSPGLLGIFIVIAFDSYIQLFFGKNLLGFIKDDPKRLSGLFGDEYILGSYLLKFFPIILFLCPNDPKKMNWLIIFYLIVIEPLIFFSGQRSQFIMSIFLVLGIFLINYKNINFYISFIICCVIILANIFFNQKYNERYIYDVKANFSFDSIIKSSPKSDEKVINFSIVSPSHTKIYFNSINMFKDKKMFGHGIKSYRFKCHEYDISGCTTHPHNFYLQILAETGLFVFIALLFFYLIIIKEMSLLLFKNFFNINTNINKKYYACLNLLIVFFPFQTNGNIFNNYMLIQLTFILSIYFISKSAND